MDSGAMASSKELPRAAGTQQAAPAEHIHELSEANLRIHTAACQKNHECSKAELSREENMRAVEHEAYRQLFGDYDHLTDEDFSSQTMDLVARREASFDALKLYSGSFASLCTPMDRFIATSPTQAAHPWPASSAMKDAGVASGDSEELDARGLASEMAGVDAEAEETQDVEMGSPRASSDTYSLARCRETVKVKKERNRRSRNWKAVKMRKRKWDVAGQ